MSDEHSDVGGYRYLDVSFMFHWRVLVIDISLFTVSGCLYLGLDFLQLGVYDN